MFARLSHRSAPWLNLRVEHPFSNREGQDALIDLNIATSLLPVNFSWCHVVTLREQSVLLCRSLRGVLEEDIHHVSKLLSELEDGSSTERPLSDEPQGSPSIEPAFTPSILHSPDHVIPEPRKRKRRRSSTLQEPLVLRLADASAPTIIITPCPSQARETSCWVPYQDDSFGTRLTVPTYTALNSVHPPMVAPTNTVAVQIDDWEYTRGHWCAVIPLPGEQCRRGMYSRIVLPRRKARYAPPRTDS